MVKDKKLVIDTSVVWRLLENEKSVVNVLYYYSKTHRILITDHSLFELLDRFESRSTGEAEYALALKLFRQYGIDMIYRESSAVFYKTYPLFLNGNFSIREAKKFLFESFRFSMTGFLTNVYSLSILALSNSLESDYNSEFYLHIRNLYDDQKIERAIRSYVNEVLTYGYVTGKIRIENKVKQDLRIMVISILSYYDLHKEHIRITKNRFKKKYVFYDNQYKGKAFNEIIKLYYKPKRLKVQNLDGIDETSFQFITNYLENIACFGHKFSINDMVDYLNFETGLKHDCSYYTLDVKSLRKYENCFNGNEKVTQYINRAKQIENVPYKSMA